MANLKPDQPAPSSSAQTHTKKPTESANATSTETTEQLLQRKLNALVAEFKGAGGLTILGHPNPAKK